MLCLVMLVVVVVVAVVVVAVVLRYSFGQVTLHLHWHGSCLQEPVVAQGMPWQALYFPLS